MKEIFKLCYEAYEEAGKTNSWKNTGESKSATFSMIEKNKDLFIVFQSTWSESDIKADLLFFPKKIKTDDGNFLVHRGIYNQFENTKSEILETVNKNTYSNIYIYGWSLGGACALFCKEFLHGKTETPLQCITIGAPRSFYFSFNNAELKEKLKNTTCYQNGGDFIPLIPFGFSNVVKKTKVGKFNLFRFFTGQDHLNYNYYNSIMNTT